MDGPGPARGLACLSYSGASILVWYHAVLRERGQYLAEPELELLWFWIKVLNLDARWSWWGLQEQRIAFLKKFWGLTIFSLVNNWHAGGSWGFSGRLCDTTSCCVHTREQFRGWRKHFVRIIVRGRSRESHIGGQAILAFATFLGCTWKLEYGLM